MMPELSIIIVSYNTRDLLVDCLDSVARESGDLSIEVIVVDNDSLDGSVSAVRERHGWVRLIEAEANIGFAAANNRALSHASGSHVLFLNPDTLLRPGALKAAVERLRSDRSVGALGCRILHPDGSVQRSARKLPTLASLTVESFGLSRMLPYGPKWGDPWIKDPDREQQVEVVKGAFLLTSEEVLRSVGAFDERFFLYSEEQDWCRRVVDAGKKVLYYPGATIVHREGSSSPTRRNSTRFIIYDSETEYFRKHDGKWTAFVARVLMFCGVVLRAIAWSLLCLMPQRAGRFATARGYWLAGLWFVERALGRKRSRTI